MYDMNLEALKIQAQELLESIVGWVVSPEFYAQIIAIIIAISLAWFIDRSLKNR